MYSFDEIANFDPEIAQAMTDEINRQDHNIELIAFREYRIQGSYGSYGKSAYKQIR